MANEISEIKNNIFNTDGNIVLDEKFDGGGRTQTIKYGLIKLIGDKQEHRVNMKTILDITKAREAKFAGQINIPELNMSVHISQIVMMRSEIETVRTENNISNLPITNVCLETDFTISQHIRPWFIRNCVPYYEATVHYMEDSNGKQYYLEFDKIKRLLKIEFDFDGYDYISEIYEYGICKNKVQNA